MSSSHHVHGYWRRHFAALFRVLHIYLSMVSFAILFFFAATGLLLNNPEWFSGKGQTHDYHGNVEIAWVKTRDADSVAKTQIVDRLRAANGIKGELHEFTVDDAQCTVSFRGPGYSADATIDRGTGAYDLTETRLGFVEVINDLHKGVDSGKAWHWVINLSAWLILLVSVTGMILIFYLKRRRFTGVTVAIVAAIVCYLVYWLFVP